MKKSLLYTRTGDAGMTSLVGGKRVAKNSPRVNAYGTLDELNAHIGLVQAHCAQLDNFVTATLLSINNTLFNLGAYLATPPAPAPADDSELPQSLRVIPDRIAELEQQIDTLDGSVPEQRTFILPGGSIGAAHAHVARTSVPPRRTRDTQSCRHRRGCGADCAHLHKPPERLSLHPRPLHQPLHRHP